MGSPFLMREKQKGYSCCTPIKWVFCFIIYITTSVLTFFSSSLHAEVKDEQSSDAEEPAIKKTKKEKSIKHENGDEEEEEESEEEEGEEEGDTYRLEEAHRTRSRDLSRVYKKETRRAQLIEQHSLKRTPLISTNNRTNNSATGVRSGGSGGFGGDGGGSGGGAASR